MEKIRFIHINLGTKKTNKINLPYLINIFKYILNYLLIFNIISLFYL
jgi:hypothetical protein